MMTETPSFEEIKHVEDVAVTKPLYVLNRTDGDIVFTIFDQQKKARPVILPRTFIPILASAVCPTSMVVESLDFRKLVFSKYVKIISNEEAEYLLNQPDYKRELERLRASSSSTDVSLSSFEAVSSLEKFKDVNAVVTDTIVRDDLSDDDKMSLLINEYKLEKMSFIDFEYIITTSTSKRITNWANKLLEKTKVK